MRQQESIVSHAVLIMKGLALDQATTIEDKIVKEVKLHVQWNKKILNYLLTSGVKLNLFSTRNSNAKI